MDGLRVQARGGCVGEQAAEGAIDLEGAHAVEAGVCRCHQGGPGFGFCQRTQGLGLCRGWGREPVEGGCGHGVSLVGGRRG